jgi:hypothetical protein
METALPKAIQKLAAGMYAVKSEGMFPYETHYVLATDEEVERLYERGRAMDEQAVQAVGHAPTAHPR